MHTLVIVGCGKKKLKFSARHKAGYLYTGNLFKATRDYAQKHGTRWIIASAKYGLVDPDTEIDNYDKTMPTNRDEVRQWGAWAQRDYSGYIAKYGKPDRVVILAGAAYVKPMIAFTGVSGSDVEVPLEGMGIGDRLRWLKHWKESEVPESYGVEVQTAGDEVNR